MHSPHRAHAGLHEPPETELVSFIDESRKPVRDPATGRVAGSGEHYVVAAAVVLRGDVAEIRNQLQEVQLRVGHPLHYQELSPSRQAQALELVDEITDWDGYLFETDRALPSASYSEHHVRAKLIERAFGYLDNEVGVRHATLETRGSEGSNFSLLNQKDHDVLRRLQRWEAISTEFQIGHSDKSAGILQICDLLAGARTDLLCTKRPHQFPLISHRVRSIESVFSNP